MENNTIGIGTKIIRFIRRDAPYLICILFLLMCMLYMYKESKTVLDSCNDHWLNEWNNKCQGVFQPNSYNNNENFINNESRNWMYVNKSAPENTTG